MRNRELEAERIPQGFMEMRLREAAPTVPPQLRWNRDADGQWFVMLSTEAGLMADGRTPNEALHAFGSVLEAAFSDECEECRGKPTTLEHLRAAEAQRSALFVQLRTQIDHLRGVRIAVASLPITLESTQTVREQLFLIEQRLNALLPGSTETDK